MNNKQFISIILLILVWIGSTHYLISKKAEYIVSELKELKK